MNTEKEIIQALACWLDDKKYPFQLANAFFYGWECDYWALDGNGIAREFEIKVTRKDFLSDAKKFKHNDRFAGANFFYYVTPDNLVSADEVPNGYGLIYVSGRLIQIVKRPRRLHSNVFDKWQDLARKAYFRYREIMKQRKDAKEITREQYRESLVLDWAETELKCEHCGAPILEHHTGRVCAYQLEQGPGADATDYTTYPRCNCCDKCRAECNSV